jgi:hypothetical protein
MRRNDNVDHGGDKSIAAATAEEEDRKIPASDASTTTKTTTSTNVQTKSRCLVCYSEFTSVLTRRSRKSSSTATTPTTAPTNTILPALLPCGHDEICGLCHLRLRFLHDDRKCPICKAAHEQIIVVDDDDDDNDKKMFADYSIWGDDLGPQFYYHSSTGIFFPKTYYRTVVEPLFGYHCTVPKCPSEYGGSQPLESLEQLQDHLRTAHRLTLCQLCVDHKRDFVAKLPRYSPQGLHKHCTVGSATDKGHPVCEFCRPTRFYDITHLHQHLHREHYKCHVCEHHLGMDNQFFKNYKSLEKHFDKMHFLCHDVQCLTARFVVFASELDLRHHERQVHGASSHNAASTKILLEFQIANSHHPRSRIPSSASQGIAAPEPSEFDYDLDGQAFVPAALPIRGDPDALHPLHAQRTQQLREQAAMIRAEQEQQQADSFPTLQPPSSSSSHDNAQQRLSVGWTSQDTMRRVGRTTQGAGTVTDQDFPSLSQSKTKKKQQIATTKKPISASWSASPAVTTTAAAATSASIRKIAAPIHNTNTTANLTAENFPSLAPSSGSHPASSRYTAADDLARRINNKNAPHLTSNDFPALGGGAKSPSSQKSSVPLQTPSSFDLHASHFPPPPMSASTSNVSLEDVKGKLGPANFKKLKNYTKQFAAGELLPDSYVDHAASVFQDGYADADFWKFVPALVSSSPARDRDAALRYMDNLKRMRNGALNAESMRSSTTNAVAVVSPVSGVPAAVRAPSHSVFHPSRSVPPTGKSKTNAWGTGGGGPSPAVRSAKAPPPTSVAAAAAAAATAPSRSTATKFMAKESKQEQWHQANPSSGKNKNKNKQKKELQALAFGK